MKFYNLENRKTGGYTTFGGVWGKGEVTDMSFVLTGAGGKEVPVQSKAMAYWSDGSIKWSSHTADSDAMGDAAELLPVGSLTQRKDRDGHNSMQGEIAHADMGIHILQNEEQYIVDTGAVSFCVPKSGGRCNIKKVLVREVQMRGTMLAERVYPFFALEHRTEEKKRYTTEVCYYEGEVCSVELEQGGPLQAVFCFRGNHVTEGNASFPFIIRMYCWHNSPEIRFMHTFLYDGEEQRDFLKGMGIRLELPMAGETYDRHIQFGTDDSVFHECAVTLASSSPRLSPEILRKQMQGAFVDYSANSDVQSAAAELPVWNRFCLFQDSAYHYAVMKQTHHDCCALTGRQGRRASGVMAVNHKEGGILLGNRDFWQKYPSGLEVDGLGNTSATATAWFYCPEAKSYDFRHYDKKSYPRTCYEGFEEMGACAQGIGVTSECRVCFTRQMVSQQELEAFGDRIQKPSVYVAKPAYYHEKRAFGYWGQKVQGNPVREWLESQMEKAFLFYKQEVEKRDWYGLFDYGDVMHTYDSVRHCWKYDVGGFAWQNTELVPTYWLGLYFLRTGREDVFSMMEAMSRHCSEVDLYHFGKCKGLGSRHNVRHWGCSCKEPRISMAGHHRILYYLTGELRLSDIFEETKDSDLSFACFRHGQVELEDGSTRPWVRSGPDWSSYVSNWMTQYEQTLDDVYRNKILQGISDLEATPYRFASGPDYLYEPEKSRLIYYGEIEDTPNQHLQICMGGPQVWLETADILEDDRLKNMLSDLGAFYYKSREEKIRLTKGQIKNRPFSWPMFAAGIAAYSAMKNKDGQLARLTWGVLFGSLYKTLGKDGFEQVAYEQDISGVCRKEIVGISTNYTSQWCLNVIMCMEFIPEYLPDTMEECWELVRQAEGLEEFI